MSSADLTSLLSAAYAWHRALGNETVETPLANFVVNREHPRVWIANHVSRVVASSPTEIDGLLREIESRFAHCDHRAIVADRFTPEAFVARLASDDWVEQSVTLQMVLEESLAAAPNPTVVIRPVRTQNDWDEFRRLVEIDSMEGARSSHGSLPPDVVDGLFDGHRRKRAAQQFFLGETAGAACGYGSAVICPNGIGLLEDFFTLPDFRGRGVASAILGRGVAHLKANGSRVIFIGALPDRPAKRLYAKLGFSPVMLTREWAKTRSPG
jgi:GNAT superfamily N-acetyltransferase